MTNAMARETETTAAARAVMHDLFGEPAARPFAVRYWSGDEERAAREPAPFTLLVNRPDGLRRMLLPPNELKIVEAFLAGDLDLEGDAESAMTLGDAINARLLEPRTTLSLVRNLLRLPSPKRAERQAMLARRAEQTVERVGGQHEPTRDQAAVRFHYDVGNDFYALWLDERMVYSCAYFESADDPDGHLEDAQEAKLELVCSKLGLRPGDRLLDVGCGWGALVMHAAKHHGVRAVGITLSEAQAQLARERIADAGLQDSCTVEIRDYRSLAGLGTFDRIASVGMVEHVGVPHLPGYFTALYGALRPGGMLLNHGIVSVEDARPASPLSRLGDRLWKRDAFIHQYVFPDGKLGPLSAVIDAAERSGFETRDVESLRPHYALTLRAWLARLMRHQEEAIAATDERTFRIWRLYMTGSAHGFASGRLNVVQTLLARPCAGGEVELPLRRSQWVTPRRTR